MADFNDKYVDGRSLEQALTDIYNTINTNKQNKTDNTLATTSKEIVGAINELHGRQPDLSGYQQKNDSGLQTEDKTIVGAINEVNGKIGSGGEIVAEEFGNTSTPTDLDIYTTPNKKYKSTNNGNKFTHLPQVMEYRSNIRGGYLDTFEIEVEKIISDPSKPKTGYYITQTLTITPINNASKKYLRMYTPDYWADEDTPEINWSWGYWYSLNLEYGDLVAPYNAFNDPYQREFYTGISLPISDYNGGDLSIYTPSIPMEYNHDLVKYVLSNTKPPVNIEFESFGSSSNKQYMLKFGNGVMIFYGIFRERFFGATGGSSRSVTFPYSFIDNSEVITMANAYKNVNNYETDAFTNIYDCTSTANKSYISIVVKTDESARYDMDTTQYSLDGVRWIAIGRWK